MNRTPARAAGVLAVLPGLGFGLPAVYGAWYLAAHGEVWYLVGYPTYGDGPFVAVGLPNSVPLPSCSCWSVWRR